jgi:hypothetical protein
MARKVNRAWSLMYELRFALTATAAGARSDVGGTAPPSGLPAISPARREIAGFDVAARLATFEIGETGTDI